ncbi:DNA (cytosine-5-)-methyltransferase [mine drainage metagenome]|uniref:DNA (Cytosine-5-)-methyltransferase n=1 Tax=mine drainage metagenome TaxID=410659 RepID=T1DGT9_9ZZZZ
MKNLAKEQWDLAHRIGTRTPSYTRQSADLKELRDDPKLAPWLAEAPSQILQQAIRDTNTAYQRFFSGLSRYPTWAKKGSRASFRDPQDVKFRRLSCRWGEVKIQGVGWIRVRTHRPLVGNRITSATVVIEPDGKMFISVLCERHKRQPTKPLVTENTTVGIDRGIAVAIATSDGELINRENWTPKEKERLRRLEQARERKKAARKSEYTKEKGALSERKSKKQEKTELQIAVLYGRARRRRKDFVEQESCDLAKNHRLSVFEDLHLSAMTRSAKGTVNNPGKRVAQKAGLNRSMLDKGLGAILSRTQDKVIGHGHAISCVPAPGTSITCPVPECGHMDPANRASRSVFICVACGYKAHADINAAIIIRERGIKLALAGGTPVTALRGNNSEPDSSGAEPEQQGRRGSGNQETGCITVREVALL